MAARSDLKRFGRDRSGATAIEYAMIACGIALVIVTVVTVFGQKTGQIFQAIATAVGAAI